MEENKIDIYIDYHPGKPFKCSKCGDESSRIHDVTERVWRHLNFFQYKCYLHCRMPRISCSNCGVHIVDVPWSRSGSGFTLMMESFILMLANNMTFKAISEMIHETDKRIFRVIKYYVKKDQEKLDCSLITSIGVDETSSKKGHNYITSFVNMETGQVVFSTIGKGSKTISEFNTFLSEHNGNPNQIQSVCCDMSPAFIQGIETTFPDAYLVFDKFHLMLAVNNTVNEVRIDEKKGLTELNVNNG